MNARNLQVIVKTWPNDTGRRAYYAKARYKGRIAIVTAFPSRPLWDITWEAAYACRYLVPNRPKPKVLDRGPRLAVVQAKVHVRTSQGPLLVSVHAVEGRAASLGRRNRRTAGKSRRR